MSDRNTDMDLLLAVGDLGLPGILPSGIDRAARAALEDEIDAAGRSPRTTARRSSRTRVHSRIGRPRLLLERWPLLTAGLAAVVAAVVVAIVSLSSGTPAAVAGWTAVPARVSETSSAVARKACGNIASTQVLAAESRGPFVAIVFARAGAPWQCITRGSRVLLSQTTRYPARLYAAVPAGKITVPSLVQHAYGTAAKRRIAELNRAEDRLFRDRTHHHSHFERDVRETARLEKQIAAAKTGPEALISLTGTTGKGVTGVRFVLADGKTVSATVQDGWYEAWWPGSTRAAATYAVRVEVTTSSGTQSSKMAYGPLIEGAGSKRCAAAAPCAVFAPTVLKPGIAPALTAHFAFFGNTSPTPISAAPRGVQRMFEQPIRARVNQYGLDDSQAREVKLPGASAIWFVPGSAGLCTTFTTKFARGHASSGGCDYIKGTLRWGAFAGISGTGIQTWLVGLVPNGNKSVQVHLASGATLTIPVHDNVVYAALPTRARSITFKNAFGNKKTSPA